ncbi:MAG: penicillin-binding protein 2 [Candidatus Gastranaerophilales bacterium]
MSERKRSIKKEIKKDKRITHFENVSNVVFLCIILFIGLLVCHLFLIMVVDKQNYRGKARSQRAGRIFSLRGDISDRNGIKLATDKVYSDVYAHPKDYDHTPEELAEILSPFLGISKTELVKKLKKAGPVITLKKDVDRANTQAIAKLHLREISLGKKNTREYPQGDLASHVLGYYNFDADIANGIEYTAKDRLEHVINTVKFQKTRDGKIIYDFTTDPVATTVNPKGEDITLTIDAAIQHVCEKEISAMVQEKNAERGAVLVMDPKTAEVLAYAVYPNFDPNYYKKATPKQLKNWTLTDVFPPGSTFKIVTVASALELGKINENSKVLDTGETKIGNWTIRNYDYDKHKNPGMISLQYLFEHSSNIGSITIAKMMSSEEFYNQLVKFGFGAKTGIDLPGESTGLLSYWKSWDEGIHATMSYGYGTSVTAMQMISAVQSIANNGVLIKPHVIKYEGEELANKITSHQVISEETAKTVTKLLAESVENGKSELKLDDYTVAGKTGTSRKPKENAVGYSEYTYTSSIGFLPASDPQLLIFVIVDSAKKGAIWGNTVAAPVFNEVATQSARILNIKPDRNIDKKDLNKEKR